MNRKTKIKYYYKDLCSVWPSPTFDKSVLFDSSGLKSMYINMHCRQHYSLPSMGYVISNPHFSTVICNVGV
jgi:hypothetical protein